MIFLCFLNHLNLPALFMNICPQKIRTYNYRWQENVGSLSFLDVKICCKNGKFDTVFTENKDLVRFSRIMKVSYQHTKTEDFYTYYFTGVLAYVVLSRHSILKLII